MQDINEIVGYFSAKKGFDRLLRAMFDSYSRYGRSFGAVRLAHPSKEEEADISEFFKRDYYNQALIRIGLADFERQIQKIFDTKVKLGLVLEGFIGRPVLTREVKAGVQKYSDELTSAIYLHFMPDLEGTAAGEWFSEMTAHMRRTYRPWVDLYQKEPKKVLQMIKTVATALNNLPVDSPRLVCLEEFAKKHAGSPLAFETNEMLGQLFLRALSFCLETPHPCSTDDCTNLFANAGLLYNGMLSRVTAMGLNMFDENGKPGTAAKVYNRRGQAFVLTLENLNSYARFSTAYGKLFVIENPLVYNAVCRQLSGTKCTVVCQMGGGTPAFLFLLKKLVKNEKTKIYYAGNLDYKGLVFADKLYNLLGKNFVPWRYNHRDYKALLEGETSLLPDEKKGLSMHNEELASLLSLMRRTGKTASTMPLLEKYVKDIKTIVGGNEGGK